MNYFTIVRRIDEYHLYWNSYTECSSITRTEVLELKKRAKKTWRDHCHLVYTGVIK